MRKIVWVGLAVFGLSAAPATRDSPPGFSPESAKEQQRTERALQEIPQPLSAEAHLRVLTRDPHVAGTPADYQTAQYVLQKFRDYGWDAELVEYEAYLPYPRSVTVELAEPTVLALDLREPALDPDPDSSHPDVWPGWHAYSPSGEVTAPVIYVNYGREEDFNRLRSLKLDVRGSIVLVRYGKNYRGSKVRLAEERGAAGVLIYSDPEDDGYGQGEVYPRGAWLPERGLQRGSINSGNASGDPTTPGWASTKGARHLPIAEAEGIPRIPSAPLSYSDAHKILQRLQGPTVPKGWQGGLPLPYRVGPGPARVHLKVDMDHQIRPLWNVMARMTGAVYPDEWVLLGNHRDAWVHGAVDPSSGTAALLEVARALGEIKSSGMQPKRTLVLGNWDGEEYALIGSVEWVEEHARELSEKVVAYINCDSAVVNIQQGFVAGGTSSLKRVLREVTREVRAPGTDESVYDTWLEQARKKARQQHQDCDCPPPRDVETEISLLGGGSDFVGFAHHLAVPSLSVAFGDDYGVYHSVYDDFQWMKNFGDPTFEYHATMARILAMLAARLAGADLIPYDFGTYARDVRSHLTQLEKRAAELGTRLVLREESRLTWKWEEEARRFDDARERSLRHRRSKSWPAVNRALIQMERNFLSPTGLPGRAWFKHLLHAPGIYTGYGAWALPGLRHAVETKDGKALAQERAHLQAALEKMIRDLRAARKLL
ncbi:MAG: M28 family metallopeptidase [Acidobacteria bacterium]|nr:M28 family metallopeptidase [Acidobacteriota bacterium]